MGVDEGTVFGHEFVGTVVSVGPSVTGFKPGDRVMSPFTTCCGTCFFCCRGLHARCDAVQLFGWVEGGAGLHGAQAQFIRVPQADATLVAIPEGLSDEAALLLGDVFSTGYFAAENGGVGTYAAEDPEGKGPVVAIVGCGPVGLVAVIAAAALGAATVLAIDSVPERLALAKNAYGAVPIDRAACDPVAAVREATGGRGADVVIEAVGLPPAAELALALARPGATISVAGCHAAAVVPLAAVYNKNLTVKSGRCPARAFMERLLPAVVAGEYNLAPLVTHRLPLTPSAYELFDSRRDGVIKVVMDPWAEG